MTEIAFLFSGKGSQYFHMGRDLYLAQPGFRAHLDRLDRLARLVRGSPVLPLMFDDSARRASPILDPELACLSIFMTEAALACTLMEAGVVPGLLVGSSMGIYAAAVAAGCLTEEEAICCLVRSAQIFRATCEPGSLTAVLAPYKSLQSSARLMALTELAAINFPGNCAIANLASDDAAVQDELSGLGLAFQRLPISRSYHSRWIEPAQDEFLRIFDSVAARRASIPMACCSGAVGLGHVSGAIVWRSIRQPMQFQKLVDQLEALGSWRYLDVGPSGTNATFLKYALAANSGSSIHPILSPAPGEGHRLQLALALACGTPKLNARQSLSHFDCQS